MKQIIHSALIALMLSATMGCANQFSASTEAYYKDGEWYYKSYKNQENFKAHIGKDADGNPQVEVETTATTAESAIAAAAKSLAIAADVLLKALPIIEKGAMTAGS